MAKLFEVVLDKDDGLYHMFILGHRVLRNGYSTPEDAWKAFSEKDRDAYEKNEAAARAIAEDENVIAFPIPGKWEDD